MASPPAISKDNKSAAAPPKSQWSDEPHTSDLFNIIVYLCWSLVIAIGRIREILSKTFKKSNIETESGYAPITSDFEDFYSRRVYGRIHDCWNRPIASCASTWIDVIERERVYSKYNTYTPHMTETGRKIHALNLGSYNYLGFGDADSPTREPVLAALEQFASTTSSTRSDAGTTTLHRETEQVVSRYVGKEDAVIIGMGYGTNSTVLNVLCTPGTLIISDSNNHASIVNGSRSGGAKIQVFKHNDVKDLERVIRTAIISGQPDNRGPWDKIFIIVEGIYSMEGETCPLPEIVKVKKQYGCYLYVDEAHSIGALGSTGRGVCEFTGVDPKDVDVLMGTFTKSFGAVGGYIAADKTVVDYIRSTSLGSLYSASISPPACQQIISAMKIILGEDGTDLGKKKLQAIYDNANYFRDALRSKGFHILGQAGSPVVPLMLYLPSNVVQFSRLLLQANVAVVVVGFPATPLLLARARFCISAGHTREELEHAVDKITEVSNILSSRYNLSNFFFRFDQNAQ